MVSASWNTRVPSEGGSRRNQRYTDYGARPKSEQRQAEDEEG
jgi:hypothetical protein